MLKTIRRIRVQRIVKTSSYYNKSKDQHDGGYAGLFFVYFFKCYFFCNTFVIVISRRQWYAYKRNLIKGL